MNAELTPERIQLIVLGMGVFILSIAVHEFGHAWAANRLGDSLPRRQGRLTLNPIAHIDPIGTILAPLLFIATTGGIGFAWGKPVQHTTTDRKQHLLIAFAGPAMNVVLATIVSLVHLGLLAAGVATLGDKVSFGLWYAVAANFMLFFFNLIPAIPLDGGSVARGLIPHRWLREYDAYSVYGPFILLAFILIPGLGIIIAKPAMYFTGHLYKGIGLASGIDVGPYGLW
jgi:Zn-dependent protease